MTKQIQVALVLSGGGARSMAHLGVIKALEDANIPIDAIVGTSGGSVIGSLYAYYKNTEIVKDLIIHAKRHEFVDISLTSFIKQMISQEGYERGIETKYFIEKHLPIKTFDELKIPFIAVVTDLITGEYIPISHGPISDAVRASSAVPGIFAPVLTKENQLLADGGISAPVPVHIAKELLNPKIIIAVDVGNALSQKEPKSTFEIVTRSLEIVYKHLADIMIKDADVVIKPDVSSCGFFDDTKNIYLYEQGLLAGFSHIEYIKNIINEKLRDKSISNNPIKKLITQIKQFTTNKFFKIDS
jgi:NTE family protein